MNYPAATNSDFNGPLWKQLADSLRCDITSGRYAPGEPVPSIRELARQHGLSRDTVLRSFDDLISRGYLETIVGAGAFVKLRPPEHSASEMSRKPGSPLEIASVADAQLSEYGKRLARLSEISSTMTDQPDVNLVTAPPELLPAKQWQTILTRHCRIQESGPLNPLELEPLGYWPLREALASFLRRSRGVKCTSNQLAVSSDAQQVLDLILRILLSPNDVVVMENPGNIRVRQKVLSLGARLYPIATDAHGLITDRLHGAPPECKLVYITPCDQDPTGAMMSLPRRLELLSWANERGVLIIEDARDSDYQYGSQPMSALQGMDTSDSVIYIHSLWKSLFPLSSTSCVVLPPPLVNVFSKAKGLVERSVPLLEHYALTDFILEGHLERHLYKTRDVYLKRRQALMYALARNFQTNVSYLKQNAGLHLLVRFDLGCSDTELIDMAKACGIAMISTARYYCDNANGGEFLIPFAWLDEKQSTDGIARLATLVTEIR